MIYFDNSATTKLDPIVKNKLIEEIENTFGNPSSMHKLGVESEKKIKFARKQVAKLIGAKDTEILFTSGGTESNNIAILGSLKNTKSNHFITTEIEHPSVLNVFKQLEAMGKEVDYIKVDRDGKIDIEKVKELIRQDTALVSIMHVNNEIGVINDINSIAEAVKKINSNIIFHSDGVQAFGKLKLNLSRSLIDVYSFSGHKIHAPKGIGGLYTRSGINLKPLFYGGSQEEAIRPGTENLHGIISLGHACEIARKDLSSNYKKAKEINEYFRTKISDVKNIKINTCDDDHSFPYIINVSFSNIRGEVLLHSLESKGVFVSTGSACTSKKKSYSHVLEAIGLSDDLKEGAIRFSFSKDNTIDEVDKFFEILEIELQFLRNIMGGK